VKRLDENIEKKMELKVDVNQHDFFCIRYTNSFTLMIYFVFSSRIINEFHNRVSQLYLPYRLDTAILRQVHRLRRVLNIRYEILSDICRIQPWFLHYVDISYISTKENRLIYPCSYNDNTIFDMTLTGPLERTV
jgi:hypothetical protein